MSADGIIKRLSAEGRSQERYTNTNTIIIITPVDPDGD